MMIGANMLDSCLEKRVKGDPAGSGNAKKAPEPPAKKRAPGAEINRQE
jgi:hypothetical protein